MAVVGWTTVLQSTVYSTVVDVPLGGGFGIFINAQRMRKRVTVLSLCVCLCVPCSQGA